MPIPVNYQWWARRLPHVDGRPAAAIIKARREGRRLACRPIYTGVPAGMFGRAQEIRDRLMGGAATRQHWLRAHRVEPTPRSCRRSWKRAKGESRVLTTEEVLAAVSDYRAGAAWAWADRGPPTPSSSRRRPPTSPTKQRGDELERRSPAVRDQRSA